MDKETTTRLKNALLAKGAPRKGDTKMKNPFERITIVGSGFLGAQIAMLAAHVGYKVKAYDPQERTFIENYDKLHNDLKQKGVTPLIPWEKWEACRDATEQTTNLGDAVKNAQFVIEAASENDKLKQSIFKQLGELTAPDCILATNSSSMPVSRFEESSGRPERCLNIHFYLPLQGYEHGGCNGRHQNPSRSAGSRHGIREIIRGCSFDCEKGTSWLLLQPGMESHQEKPSICGEMASSITGILIVPG